MSGTTLHISFKFFAVEWDVLTCGLVPERWDYSRRARSSAVRAVDS